MGRVSQAQARENRKRIVETASRLFRERGVAAVSVADVMAEAGLTHGGFYRQFASKEALVAEAVGHAFGDRGRQRAARDERDGHDAAPRDFVDTYLSARHRPPPGDGCLAAALCADIARED